MDKHDTAITLPPHSHTHPMSGEKIWDETAAMACYMAGLNQARGNESAAQEAIQCAFEDGKTFGAACAVAGEAGAVSDVKDSKHRILTAAEHWAEQRELGPTPAKAAWRALCLRVEAELAVMGEAAPVAQCIACEGKPSGDNVPCAVCGAPAALGDERDKDAGRWRELDTMASDPEFELSLNSGGWAILKMAIDAALALQHGGQQHGGISTPNRPETRASTGSEGGGHGGQQGGSDAERLDFIEQTVRSGTQLHFFNGGLNRPIREAIDELRAEYAARQGGADK